jgi:hypothetical protein
VRLLKICAEIVGEQVRWRMPRRVDVKSFKKVDLMLAKNCNLLELAENIGKLCWNIDRLNNSHSETELFVFADVFWEFGV